MSEEKYKQRIPGGGWLSYDDPDKFQKDAVFRSDIIKNYVAFPNISVYQIGYCYQKTNKHYFNHVTKHFKLVYVLEGSGWFNGMQVKSGQGFLMWENHVNSISADVKTPWGYIYVSFMGSMAEQLLKHAGFQPSDEIFEILDIEKIKKLCFDVIYAKQQDKITDIYLMSILLYLISLNKQQFLENEKKQQEHISSMKGYVVKAIEFMSKHYRQQINIQDISNAVYVSEKYLRKIFKEQTGKSMQEYLTDLRLNSSTMLLMNSRYNISEIANLSGYDEYRNFVRLFKKKYNMTPTEYRDKVNAIT